MNGNYEGLVIAKSVKGREYLYSTVEMFAVSKRSSQAICNELNRIRYNLQENETWHIYERYAYDNEQPNGKLFIRNGVLKLKHTVL